MEICIAYYNLIVCFSSYNLIQYIFAKKEIFIFDRFKLKSKISCFELCGRTIKKAGPARRTLFELALRHVQTYCEGPKLDELSLSAATGYLQLIDKYYSGFVTEHSAAVADMTDEEKLNAEHITGIDIGLIYFDIQRNLNKRVSELQSSTVERELVHLLAPTRVQTHLDDLLLSLSNIQRPSTASYRQLIDKIQNIVKEIRKAKVPFKQWSQDFIFAFVQSMDNSTAQAWESHRDHKMPTLEMIKDFLENRAREMDGAADIRPHAIRTTMINSAHKQCLQCHGKHALIRCPRFLAMSVATRERRVSKWKLCVNCLHTGHYATSCKSGPCRQCPNAAKHNSLLCRRSKAQMDKRKLLKAKRSTLNSAGYADSASSQTIALK